MDPSQEAAIFELAVDSFQKAIRREAARILEMPGALGVTHFRAVERLMRIALALAGAGSGLPYVEMHGIPPSDGPQEIPELFSIELTDLLAARAADQLPGALRGDPASLLAFEQEAERLLKTENIQLV